MARKEIDRELLIEAAKTARESAYAPYSKFKMGAAVLTDQGAVVPGKLIENISLGLSMCAERVALFSVVNQSAGTPMALVLHAPKTDGAVTWPCGACLQVAMELGGPDMTIIAANGAEVLEAKIGEIAPKLPVKRNN